MAMEFLPRRHEEHEGFKNKTLPDDIQPSVKLSVFHVAIIPQLGDIYHFTMAQNCSHQ